jgi:uncharacterized membrane protein YidH (DUF202 family)
VNDRGSTSRRSVDDRTDLAWNRSGLAIVGCGLIVARGLTLNGFQRSDIEVGVVILGLGLASYLLAAFQNRRRITHWGADRPARPADLLPLAIGVAIIGAAAFVLGLLFPA